MMLEDIVEGRTMNRRGTSRELIEESTNVVYNLFYAATEYLIFIIHILILHVYILGIRKRRLNVFLYQNLSCSQIYNRLYKLGDATRIAS